MIKEFCDRCEAEIPGRNYRKSYLHVAAPNGDVIDEIKSLCPDCSNQLYIVMHEFRRYPK